MKISNRTHPILEKLFKGSLGIIPIHPSDPGFIEHVSSNFVRIWKENVYAFSKEVNIPSKAFLEASKKAQVKMLTFVQEIMDKNEESLSIQGTYIINNQVFMLNYETIAGDPDIKIVIYVFSKEGCPVFMHKHDSKVEGSILGKKDLSSGWASNGCKSVINDQPIEDMVVAVLGDIISIALFKKYAEVETKYLLPGQKSTVFITKYVNDTKLPLTYLDSKWFTNLIKSDAFTVSGHFRLQPYKVDGVWTKKLIWISEFEKEGYTAPARKLAVQPEL